MTLYVTSQFDAPHGEKYERTWLIGESTALFSDRETVIEIIAGGSELYHIISTFHNLCYPVGKHAVTWKGEMAQFIWDNL